MLPQAGGRSIVSSNTATRIRPSAFVIAKAVRPRVADVEVAWHASLRDAVLHTRGGIAPPLARVVGERFTERSTSA